MKRSLGGGDEEAGGKKTAGKKTKKQRFNPIKGDLPASTSKPEVLVHKNRELAVLVKRMRKRLKTAREKASALEIGKKTADSVVSAANRAIASFITGANELIGKSSVEIEAAPGTDGNNKLLDALLGDGAEKTLLEMISAQVPEKAPSADEDTEDAALDDLPAIAHKEFTNQVEEMLNVLKNLLAKFEDSKTVQLMGNDKLAEKGKTQTLRNKMATYVDRIKYLESEVRSLRNKVEDTTNEKDVTVRRLAAVCSEALGSEELNHLAEKIGLKATKVPAGSSVSSTDRMETETKDQTELSKEDNDDAKLATERLDEIKRLVEEKKKLIEEAESLRASLSLERDQEHGATQQSKTMSKDPQIAFLQGEIELAKKDLSQHKELLEEATKALAESKRTAAKFAEDREREVAKSLSERDTQIATYRSKLEASREETKEVKMQQASEKEYKVLFETTQERVVKLEADIKRLEESPTAKVMREKLEELVEKTWPNDAEKKTIAMLKADLEASAKELEQAKSYEDELLNECEAVTNSLEEIKKQNVRLLEEKNPKGSRWVLVDLNEKLGKMRNNLSVAKKEAEAQRIFREQSDKKFQDLQTQYKSCLAAIARTEEIVIQARSKVTASEDEKSTLKNTIDRFDVTKQQLQKKIEELQQSNARYRKEREDALQEQRRAEEDRRKAKRSLEKLRNAPLIAGDLRTAEMENALRCPLRSEFWKDCIIMKCSHMFSRKALMDNLAKRNRNCPSCKHKYNVEDIKDIFLYQSNDYDEED